LINGEKQVYRQNDSVLHILTTEGSSSSSRSETEALCAL